MTAPKLYQLLVRLHPRAFRERFCPEMLCVFDEAVAVERRGLFIDCLVSLARQWVLRSGLWIIAAAGLGALVQIALAGTAWLAAGRRALSTFFTEAGSASGSLPLEGTLLLASGILTAMLLGVTILAMRISRKASGIHRSPGPRGGTHK
jgi:hypothetical protein